MAQRIAVDGPAALPQLPVDDLAGACLVKIDGDSSLFGAPDSVCLLPWRRLLGCRLEGRKLLGQDELCVLGFLRELFPGRTLFRFPAGPLFRAFTVARGCLCLGAGKLGRLRRSASSARSGWSFSPRSAAASTGSGGGTNGPALKPGCLPKVLWNQMASCLAVLSAVSAWA